MQKGYLKTGGALLVCSLLVFASGCRKRTVMAAPPVIVTPTPEATQPAASAPAETKTAPAPETPPATTPAPPAHPPKPAPRKTNPASNTSPPPENPAPTQPKPAAPQISPQLSPGDQASYQRKTNENIAAAEKNLQQAYGRELNAAQHDLVEKINGFLGQARQAIRESDWARASTLAEKARVLSVELFNSF